MLTFIPSVPYFKEDGTGRVMIKVTHNRKRKYILTDIFITKVDITKGGKIKNEEIKTDIEEKIKHYRKLCSGLPLIQDMTLDEIMRHIKSTSTYYIDFIQFGKDVAEKCLKTGKEGTAKNIIATINSLVRYTGDEKLNINSITFKFLTGYEEWLRTTPSIKYKNTDVYIKGRAISLYIGHIRELINRAKDMYNDDETDIIKVRVSPFPKFKIKKPTDVAKRALSADLMQAIKDMHIEPGDSRKELGRDVFMLSFYLAGMNEVDLYTCTKLKDGLIIYNRSKTKGRRDDQALMHIRVEPEAMELLTKYLDPTGKRLFNFYKRYSALGNFVTAVNKGLKKVGADVGVPDLTCYAARHSWATIAINDCHVDKYLVHEALNHVDETMRITDLYITKDFSRIWEVNRKVIAEIKIKWFLFNRNSDTDTTIRWLYILK